MTQELLNLGPMPPIIRPAPGDTVVANRPKLGRCVLKVRRVHPTAITADRIEVIDRARARGETVPRTKPTTLVYSNFIITGDPQPMTTTEDAAALRVRCPYCKAVPGQRCSTKNSPRSREAHPERFASELRSRGRETIPIQGGSIELSDPAPIGARELRNSLTAIRESLEKCPVTDTARANIAKRIRVIEDRLTAEVQL